MDDDKRTLWCGNLSEKVTEDILYELFLQGGPIQRLCIPKDRDGKQRTYGFVTYKYIHSVSYALDLFDGTMLYNRPLSMKLRNNVETKQSERSPALTHTMNHMLQLAQQMIIGNLASEMNVSMFGTDILQNASSYSDKSNKNSCNDERKFRRTHPYPQRDRDRTRNKDRERNRERNYSNYYRDGRPHCSKDNNYHSNDHFRHNDYKKRWNPR